MIDRKMASDAPEVHAAYVEFEGLAVHLKFVAVRLGIRRVGTFAVLALVSCRAAGIGSGAILAGGFTTGRTHRRRGGGRQSRHDTV